MLRISTRREDGELRVAFADTGPGMTDAQRERAFTGMLSTTKEKGGGLGLANVGGSMIFGVVLGIIEARANYRDKVARWERMRERIGSQTGV